MTLEFFVTRKKCLLRKKKLFQLVKMLFLKYTQSKLQYTTSQSITTLQVHITTSEAFLFFHLSLIVTNALFCTFCLAVQRFLLQGFAGSPHSFGWLLIPRFHRYSCLVSFVIIFLPFLVYLTAINSLHRG